MKKRIFDIPEQSEDFDLHWLRFIEALNTACYDAPKGCVVTISKPSLTDRQRGAFHAQAQEVADRLGYTLGQIKEMVKADLMGYEELKVGEKWHRVTRSSEDYDRDEYSRLIEHLPIWMSENGI